MSVSWIVLAKLQYVAIKNNIFAPPAPQERDAPLINPAHAGLSPTELRYLVAQNGHHKVVQ